MITRSHLKNLAAETKIVKKQVEFDGKKVTIVGTAHVSEESIDEVSETIEEENPDLVAVELDESRLKSMREKSGWKDMNLSEAIRDGKGGMLFANLLLSIYQRQLGMEQGVEPGQEMLSAVEKAEEEGIETALIDRDIGETLSRIRSELSLWQKYLLTVNLLIGGKEEVEEIDVEEMKQPKTLESLIDEMGEEFPAVKRVLLDERNSYMAEQLRQRDFEHAVVVVGAAHMDGLAEELEEPTEIKSQETGGGWPVLKIIKYGFPLAAIAVLGFTLLENTCKFYEVAAIWVGFNAAFAGIGAIAARAHLATVITSIVSAPLTSLSPVIGAGYVATYVEAKLYPPTVQELEDIPYISEYSELWGNQAGRILLVFALVTVGSAVATFIGTGLGIQAATGAC